MIRMTEESDTGSRFSRMSAEEQMDCIVDACLEADRRIKERNREIIRSIGGAYEYDKNDSR